jgi:DNA-binding FadR family transcriptional regulator
MFERIQKQPLSEIIAGKVEESILSGAFPIGSRLPSEQSLATQFGVSRNVVREAFKILQERGLIEIQDGSGAFVTQPNSEFTKNAFGRYIKLIGADLAIDALYETRMILEGQNARMAAARALPEDIEELALHLEHMRENVESGGQWTEADLDFHISVAKATHNPFQVLLLEPLVAQLRAVIWEGFLTPGASAEGLAAHVRLYNSIKDRDADNAYLAMIEHLHHSEQISLKRLEKQEQSIENNR